VLRALAPETTEDGFVSLGAFEPSDAKRLLRLLEEHQVPFEVEADHSALMQPGRAVGLYLGMNPTGSRLNIYIPKDHLPYARKLLRWLYPPEKAPPSSFLHSGPASGPPPAPAMEVYTPPSAELRWDQRRDFYAEPGEEPGEEPPAEKS
jgi:hypothetical protein